MNVSIKASAEYLTQISESKLFHYQNTTDFDCVFVPEPNVVEIQDWLQDEKLFVVVGCAKTGLAKWVHLNQIQFKCKLLGFNEIPYFVNFPKLELTAMNPNHIQEFKTHFDANFVEDSPGFVAARIISMIVNEAAFMVTEQIADFPSIDLGMKLGTNYPAGPSEWLQFIGIDSIYHILSELHFRNPDGRYKIAPYLQKLYFKNHLKN